MNLLPQRAPRASVTTSPLSSLAKETGDACACDQGAGEMGRLAEATHECLRAIEIDAEFGNPYNDIGVYLMQQDKLDESIRWLEKAKQAKRYQPRHFPFLNLGRIYVLQGRWWQALREFEEAVRLAPRDARAARILHRLRGRLN